MKKFLALLGACVLALSLSCCGGDKEEPKPETSASVAGGSASAEDTQKAEVPDHEPGLISTIEDVVQPEQENAEKTVDDADALEQKWKDEGKKYAEANGISTSFVGPTFTTFSSDTIESYRYYLNANDDWKAGDKVKIDFYCQTVEPAVIKVWVAPDTDEQKGQLTEVMCGVDTPAHASWEYTLSADTNNLLISRHQVPVEGFMITDYTKM
uniref:hypothetical protein n=1 Tax=Vaginimicrobium propionicum TaxID=1871034 RepID=UPI0009705661|nr:hypothetical protein [Vaginimicrobium propionicum]